MENPHAIIRRPLITEKSTAQKEANNKLAFEVDRRANKIEIKNAVEKIYGVKVEKVRTANHQGKPRRRGRMMGTTSSWKKAVVYLAPDNHIDLF